MPHPSRPGAVPLRVEEPLEVPALSLLLGYGAMLPFAAGVLAAWLAPSLAPRLPGWLTAVLTLGSAPVDLRPWFAELTTLWGCAILCFLSGVRRGLSFRTPGGPQAAQLVTMLGLFGLGLAALLLHETGRPRPALALLVLGYASLGVLDPLAARTRETPPSFARLRPVQMAIPVLCLLALLVLS